MKTLLVDTNVIIDCLCKREPYDKPARLLLALGYAKELDLWFSSSQATDLIYVLSDGGKRSQAQEAKRVLSGLRRFMHVCAIDEADLDAALVSTWDDVEDALVHQAALKIRASAIITRNKRDFAQSSIPVFDCHDFFAQCEADEGVCYEEIVFAGGVD